MKSRFVIGSVGVLAAAVLVLDLLLDLLAVLRGPVVILIPGLAVGSAIIMAFISLVVSIMVLKARRINLVATFSMWANPVE